METVDAVAIDDKAIARLPLKERVLLKYVKVLTREPAKMTDALTQEMRAAGWTDPEIFEAAFITSLFAFFNRMAEAYGLGFEAPWRPPTGVRWPAEPLPQSSLSRPPSSVKTSPLKKPAPRRR